MSEPWLVVAWCGVVLLFFISAFFSSSETAIMGVNRLRLKSEVDRGDRRAALIERLLSDTNRLLSGILLGNNFANVMLASISTALAIEIWGEFAPLYVSPVLTVLLLIFAEIVPKTLASRRAMVLSRIVAPPLDLFIRLAKPLVWLVSRASDMVLLLFRASSGDREAAVSAEDFKTMARVGHEEGSISRVTHDLLHGLYDFTNASVKDVMVPRHEIVSLPLTAGLEGFRDIVESRGHTRIPVWSENEEDIVGTLHAKDLLHRPGRPRKISDLSELLRPVIFVPESTRIGRVLRRMQDEGSEMVFVVDEYGGLEGLVTLKDILEELVGDIEDEHEKRGRRVDLIRPGTIISDANVTLRYLMRKTNLDLTAEKDARTLGGLLVQKAPGELTTGMTIEAAGVSFTVLGMNGRFLRKVRIDWEPDRADTPDEPAA